MPPRRTICFIFIVLLCCLQLISADHTICQDNQLFGIADNNLNQYDDIDPDGGTNIAYLHTGSSERINCCGILDRYRFEIDGGGDIYFMIWRPVGDGVYELISHLYKNCNRNDRCDIDVNNALDQVTVKAGDLYGWYSPNAEILQYSTGSGFDLVSTTTLSPSLGMTHNWSVGVTPVSNRIHGINIRVDENNDPVFSAPGNPTAISIPESTSIGSTVYTGVSANDQDVSDDASLSITMAAHTHFGYTNTSTTAGVVTVTGSLASASSPATLTFTVNDQCHNTDTATLEITITNVAATFDDLPYSVRISEHIADIYQLAIINVTDYNDTINCFVDSVTPTNAFTSTASFMITKISDSQFNLTTSNVATFYYTVDTYHDVRIRCNDGVDNTFGVVTVDIEKNDPVKFTNLPNSRTLREETSTETFLMALTYSDSDQPLSATTLSLGTGSTPATYADYFRIRQIDNTTDWGIYSKHGASFNISQYNTFNLQVIANDQRDDTIGTFTVYILANGPPSIPNLGANVSVHSDSPIGFVIYHVESSDPENDTVYYTYNCTPDCSIFNVLHDGTILLNQNIESLNITGYNISVTVHDARNTGETKTLSVHIAGINNLPNMVTLNNNVNIPEGTAIGTYIANATCNDIDVPSADILVYSISCTPTWGATFVNISDTDGVIRTLTTINYESIPVATGARTFTCEATCSDRLASSSSTMNITILDQNEPPVFSQTQYTVNVNEGPPNATSFTPQLSVTDEDTGDTLAFTHNCSSYTGLFIINSANGQMSFGADIDVDTTAPQLINCLIIATDSGGLAATATVTIIVANVNDNTPTFNSSVYTFTVWKHAAVSSPVGTITATDGDMAPLNVISYDLDQTSIGCACFAVTSSGQLIVGQSLVGFNNTYFSFTATATDQNGLFDTAIVRVYLRELTTTTPPDRYWKFIDDPNSLAWLISAVVIFAVAAGVIGFLVFTTKSTVHASTLKCQCCRLRRSFTPKRSKRPRQSRSRSPVAHTQYRQFPQIKPV